MEQALGAYGWQLLKIAAFMAAAVVGVKLLQRVLFPPEKGDTAEEADEPPREWLEGAPLTPEDLREGDEVLRDDSVLFVFMRKAEPDEYREGVEEWLFHPPGREKDLWIGMVREDFSLLRRPALPREGGEPT